MDLILGLGIALPVTSAVGVGTVTGVAQGVSHQQKVNEEAANNESRQLKFHLDVHVADPSALKKGKRAEEVDGGMVVIRDDKVNILFHSFLLLCD